MARLRRFFAEAPIFFIAVVVGVALTFRVAIGWAKASPEDPAKDPTLPGSTAVSTASTSTSTASSPAKTGIPVVTAEPRPAATATVTGAPTSPRKRSRPHR